MGPKDIDLIAAEPAAEVVVKRGPGRPRKTPRQEED
jgi:hypothetical protein